MDRRRWYSYKSLDGYEPAFKFTDAEIAAIAAAEEEALELLGW